jgi:uncharacterized protein (DUF1330 family)
MPAYFIAEMDVHDPVTFAGYAEAVIPLVAAHGGKWLVRGGATIARDGVPPGGRVIVIEFANADSVRTLLDSAEFEAIAPIRDRSSTMRTFIVEGI